MQAHLLLLARSVGMIVRIIHLHCVYINQALTSKVQNLAYYSYKKGALTLGHQVDVLMHRAFFVIRRRLVVDLLLTTTVLRLLM